MDAAAADVAAAAAAAIKEHSMGLGWLAGWINEMTKHKANSENRIAHLYRSLNTYRIIATAENVI